MLILGLNLGLHDGAAALFDNYNLIAAVQQERITRVKGDGDGFNNSSIDEVLNIAGTTRDQIDVVAMSRAFLPTRYLDLSSRRNAVYNIRRLFGWDVFKDIAGELKRNQTTDTMRLVKTSTLKRGLRLREDAILFFSNHHFSHALSAFFYTNWDDALLYTADGCGDNVHYSIRHYGQENFTSFYGDDRWLLKPREINSLGLAYGYVTEALGYKMNRHEGKITGLASFGKPAAFEVLNSKFWVNSSGIICSSYPNFKSMQSNISELSKTLNPADFAASIQKLLETIICQSIQYFVLKSGTKKIAVAGGVFANVSLNRKISDETGVEEIFVFPGMGDEGLSIGSVLEFLLERDGEACWLRSRRMLEDVYLGRDYDTQMLHALNNASNVVRIPGVAEEVAAEQLVQGKICGIFRGRMEFGPRALGNRSIMAAATDKKLNVILNQRLNRTEFMPFAPVVLEERASEVFEINASNRYACRFMTITCLVKEKYREKIPAVVHVDGTARPQTISRSQNPFYHSIINAYMRRSGLPVLVNTSFNAHEEPIINTPQEAITALRENRVDCLVTPHGVYQKRGF